MKRSTILKFAKVSVTWIIVFALFVDTATACHLFRRWRSHCYVAPPIYCRPVVVVKSCHPNPVPRECNGEEHEKGEPEVERDSNAESRPRRQDQSRPAPDVAVEEPTAEDEVLEQPAIEPDTLPERDSETESDSVVELDSPDTTTSPNDLNTLTDDMADDAPDLRVLPEETEADSVAPSVFNQDVEPSAIPADDAEVPEEPSIDESTDDAGSLFDNILPPTAEEDTEEDAAEPIVEPSDEARPESNLFDNLFDSPTTDSTTDAPEEVGQTESAVEPTDGLGEDFSDITIDEPAETTLPSDTTGPRDAAVPDVDAAAPDNDEPSLFEGLFDEGQDDIDTPPPPTTDDTDSDSDEIDFDTLFDGADNSKRRDSSERNRVALLSQQDSVDSGATKFVAAESAETIQLPMRQWTDNTGKYTTTARLVKIGDNHVRLLKDSGRLTTVPMRRLSRSDAAYVKTQQSVLGTEPIALMADR